VYIDPKSLSEFIGLKKYSFEHPAFLAQIDFMAGGTTGLKVKFIDIDTIQTIPWDELPSHFPRDLVEQTDASYLAGLMKLGVPTISKLLFLTLNENDPSLLPKIEIEFAAPSGAGLHVKLQQIDGIRTIPWENLPEDDCFCRVSISDKLVAFHYDIALALAARGFEQYLGDAIPLYGQHVGIVYSGFDFPRAKILLACNRETETLLTEFKRIQGNVTLHVSLLTCATLENNLRTYKKLRGIGKTHQVSDLAAKVIYSISTEITTAIPAVQTATAATATATATTVQATVQATTAIAAEAARVPPKRLEAFFLKNYMEDMQESNKSPEELRPFAVLALEEAAHGRQFEMFQQLLDLYRIDRDTPVASKFILYNSRYFRLHAGNDLIFSAMLALQNNLEALTIKEWLQFLRAEPDIEHKIVSYFFNRVPANYSPTLANTQNPTPLTPLNANNYIFLGEKWKKVAFFKQVIQNIPENNIDRANNRIIFSPDATIDKILALKQRMTNLGLHINWGQKFPIETRRSFFRKEMQSLEEHLIKLKKRNPRKFEAICNAVTIDDFKQALSTHPHWQYSDKTETISSKLFAMANFRAM
jgi:hypothetical protein